MERIESTSKRLEMIEALKSLLLELDEEEIGPTCFMLLGSVAPDYMGIEIGMAEKLVTRSIAKVAGISELEVERRLKHVGDIGEAAYQLLSKKRIRKLISRELSTHDYYKAALDLSRLSGKGSISQKLDSFAKVLVDSSPKEAKYFVRYVTGNLRLGIADMTLLDALSEAFAGGRENRNVVERAYNIRPDIGFIATQMKRSGLKGLSKVKVQMGIPIRMQLAERLSSSEEIAEKLGVPCAVEFKYDGERIQVHKDGTNVQLFSRRLENITYQYPDIINAVLRNTKAKEAIMELECVATDPDTGELRPFQELMRRRRKYGIKEMTEKIPVALKVFDLLFVNGSDLTKEPYSKRRKALERTIKEDDMMQLAEMRTVDSSDEISEFFDQSVSAGMEGIMAKSLGANYEAGARSFRWVKLKREYKSELRDTLDLVVVGAYAGMGKRSSFRYGSFLMSVYDPNREVFPTVCKVGTGFTEKDLEQLGDILEKHRIQEKSSQVDSKMQADFWFNPVVVLEIIGAEITLSPVHTSGWDAIKKGAGLAIRFPRFTGNYRLDKGAEDATTTSEIIDLYSMQLERAK